ncbi:methanethiol oxidase-like isoform X2 [Dermacentor variabilis]|uniref:methanethiol oxidase-like isoform X2 n=1 Tax=Dermacentor variabilis TaxID=34621 RepID=UPI003F5BA125
MNRNYIQGRNRGCASTANRVGVERCPDSVGYRTPLEAMTEGGHEKMLWLPCSVPQKDRPDYLATVCVDQDSPDYCKVVHRLEMPYCGDSLHHMNWNTCSSCYGNPSKRRDKLVLPCLDSDRVYVADLAHNPRAPTLYKVIEGDELHREGLSAPHTPHCLASGEVMISTMGDENENAKGSFLLLEERTFNVRGTWQPQLDVSDFGYDFWYQPRHNVMVSSQWGAPSAFRKGFNMADVEQGLYGSSLVVWDWTYRRKLQTIDLGPEGTMPLEVRFLHNPDASEGYVGCALGGTVFRFFKTEASEESWAAEKVISVPAKKVKGWAMDVMPGLHGRLHLQERTGQGAPRRRAEGPARPVHDTGQACAGSRSDAATELGRQAFVRQHDPLRAVGQTVLPRDVGGRRHGNTHARGHSQGRPDHRPKLPGRLRRRARRTVAWPRDTIAWGRFNVRHMDVTGYAHSIRPLCRHYR